MALVITIIVLLILATITVAMTIGEDGTEIEASEQEVVQGTPLKVSFDVTFEEGTLIGVNKGSLENGKVEYMTDGTQTEVIFVVTGQTREEIETKQTKKLY